MTEEKLKLVEQESQRLLKRIKELRQCDRTYGYYGNPKEMGAVRRSSMDLTRALADLRRPAA